MRPGDIVIGKCKGCLRAYVRADGTLQRKNFISVYSHKEAFLLKVVSGGRYIMNNHPECKDFKETSMASNEVKGMIVDFDTLNSKRPHVDGIAAVLIGEQVWWIPAENLQVIKLGIM